MIRTLLIGMLLAASGPPQAQTAAAEASAVALKGHDPVSYFLQGRPVRGQSSLAYDFDDSRYLFASAGNRQLFASDPDRYAPQFGGLCAAGLAMGNKTEADPSVWKIVDGKLYVFSSVRARELVDQDPSLLAKAQQSFATKH